MGGTVESMVETLIGKKDEFKNVGEAGNKFLSKVEKIGVIGGYLDAANAVYEAFENPTAGNITKAALKTVLAFAKTNPVVNLVIAAADLTGLTDKIFNW